jgi:hypothetical protein
MWPHGNVDILKEVMSKDIKKTNNVYFHFNISTNKIARTHCKNMLESIGMRFDNYRSHSSYLYHLASHKYAICPEGNGIDSHRIWECYYLKVIPILLRSAFSEQLQIPCILLDKWSDIIHHIDVNNC